MTEGFVDLEVLYVRLPDADEERAGRLWPGQVRPPREQLDEAGRIHTYCRSQPWVDRLALEREDSEDAFVDAVVWFVPREALQRLHAEGKFAESE